MFTTKSCCCCISLRTGAILLGITCWLNMLQEITEFYPIRLAASAIAAIAFLIMMMDDTEGKRKLYFWSFFASTIVMYIFSIYNVVE